MLIIYTLCILEKHSDALKFKYTDSEMSKSKLKVLKCKFWQNVNWNNNENKILKTITWGCRIRFKSERK